MTTAGTFDVSDYIVMGLFLAISLAIGIYYGVYKKQTTTEEYLYGNRQMHLLPVGISLLVSFQSAGSLLGLPADVYLYNSMIFYTIIGIMLATVVAVVTIVPLLYPLRLNSAYEYLGRRFNSRSVQLLGTIIGMLKTVLYMSTILYAPALALEEAVGIPLWMSVFVIGAIGTIYTSVGGFRSVIWTDVFQFVLLYSGVIIVVILGGKKVGSLERILQIAEEGDRTTFYTDIDPRVRHSIWACVIGSFFTWLVNCCNQSAVQRICSMRSERDAKIAFLFNLPLQLIFAGLITLTGLVMYAYFANDKCGPMEAGYVGNANQMMPYFVILILGNIPALAGLFLAALFSGSLRMLKFSRRVYMYNSQIDFSTLSSGINALATNTVSDLLGIYLGNTSEAKKTRLAKLFVFGYGLLVMGIAYAMKSNTGPVTQLSSGAFGACGGPYVGMFCLGAIFPQANWIGALAGGITGIVFNVWLALSAILLGNSTPHSQPIPTSGCLDQNTTLLLHHNGTAHVLGSQEFTSTSYSFIATTEPTQDASGHSPLYDISYLYYGVTGFVVSLISGLIVSLVINKCSGEESAETTDPKYIFPFLRNYWQFSAQYALEDDNYKPSAAELDKESKNDSIQALKLKSLNGGT